MRIEDDANILANEALAALSLLQTIEGSAEPKYVGWYCAHCERGVDGSEVTYHEQHEVCGRVISNDRPPKRPSLSVDEVVRVVTQWDKDTMYEPDRITAATLLRERLTKAIKRS
jgi:hypothetical protein